MSDNEKIKLLMLRGLPASGKTTYAKELEEAGWVRVERDDIRRDERIFPGGYVYSKLNEKKAVRERDRLIRQGLGEGKNVVSSDTNLTPNHVRRLMSIAQEYDAVFEIEDRFLAVPLRELIERDKKRENKVGEQVIKRMFYESVKKMPTWIEYDPNLPMVVIADIDGTLAHMNGKRGPFDWARVGVDDVDDAVAHTLDSVRCSGYAKIFLFSGRSDICRKETEEWLERNDIEYDALFMKPHGRVMESDETIKREFLLEHVVGKYNVLFVIDDRVKICRMWRDEFGLKVFQVGDPYFEF